MILLRLSIGRHRFTACPCLSYTCTTNQTDRCNDFFLVEMDRWVVPFLHDNFYMFSLSNPSLYIWSYLYKNKIDKLIARGAT